MKEVSSDDFRYMLEQIRCSSCRNGNEDTLNCDDCNAIVKYAGTALTMFNNIKRLIEELEVE